MNQNTVISRTWRREPSGRGAPPRTRRGFSILEVSMVAALTAFLALMVSGAWTGFGRAMADTIAQAKIVSEAELALQTIRRDLRGSLPGTETGKRDAGLLVGRITVGGDRLFICYDSSDPNGRADWRWPDRVLRYEVRNGQLVRIDQTTGTVFVVANHVQDFRVASFPDRTRVDLELRFRDFERRYSLIVRQP